MIDGRGAWEATSLWHGRDGHLEHLWTIPWPNSLGLFYAQFTDFLGFTPYSDEWKVMGLAPYGEPGINLREFLVPDDNPYSVASRLLSAAIPLRSLRSNRVSARGACRNPRSPSLTKTWLSPCRTLAKLPCSRSREWQLTKRARAAFALQAAWR